MSLPQPARQAKLVIGVFLNQKCLSESLVISLISLYGRLDMISPWFDFVYTDYYHTEMGSPLYRRLFVFRNLIEQESLSCIKLQTNDIEKKYLDNGKRCVNLDPGYLLLERFVLATGKNFSHRIHLRDGIYADLTLIYQNGQYQCLPWTYPDYAADELRGFLLQVRQKYSFDVKA
jgi:hypothetical protein